MDWNIYLTRNNLCTYALYKLGGGQVAACNTNCGTKYDPITGYRYIQKYNETALKVAVVDGPVAVAVDASTFQHYSSGTIFTAACGISWNHAVLLVGYGSSTTTDYWLIKNSWGSTWGTQGYIKICRNCNKNVINGVNNGQCGILGYTPGVPTFSTVPTAKGCRSESEKIEVITDKIYGCKGIFSGGISGAEPLCTDGYSVCKTQNQVQALGLTQAMCSSTTIFPSTTEYYATLQSSQGWAICKETGENDIWGCSNPAVTPKYQQPCGVLIYRIGNPTLPAHWSYSGGLTESSTAALSNIAGGGVLCCAEGTGCKNSYQEKEVVANKIYACSGVFSGGVSNGGEELCADGYEICQTGVMSAHLGLTESLCKSSSIFTNTNQFFASKQSSNGNWICTGSGYNDIWGCSNPSLTAKYTGHNCSALQYMIGNQKKPTGWNWASWTTESSTASLNTFNGGGILCCKTELNNPSTEYMSQCAAGGDNLSSSNTINFVFVVIFVFFCFLLM